MDSSVALELVGYTASGLIVLSITQKSILKLRVLGFIGSLTFLVYSVAIQAFPIAVVNLVAASIHAWYLRKLIRKKAEVFRVLHVDAESKYLLDFLDFYADEIQSFQPEFIYSPSEDQVTAFILRDMVPAGLLIGQPRTDDTFEVNLDFVIPQYRDFRIGRYVYESGSELFGGPSPTCVFATANTPDHGQYLKRMGFAECEHTPGRYEIQVAANT